MSRGIEGWIILRTCHGRITRHTSRKIIPEPLGTRRMTTLIRLMGGPPHNRRRVVLSLLRGHVPPNISRTTCIGTNFLATVAGNRIRSPLIDGTGTARLLNAVRNNCGVRSLISLLGSTRLTPVTIVTLSRALLVFSSFCSMRRGTGTNGISTRRMLRS